MPAQTNAIRALFLSVTMLVSCIEESVEINASGLQPRSSARNGAAEAPTIDRRATLKPDPAPVAATPSINQQLIAWYGVRANYDLVIRDVRKFYSPVYNNGCVAFLSAALRRIGVEIPLRVENEESPSLVTRPFARYLEERLGWARITAAQQLEPGDVVFTRDNPSWPGYPAHTYVFHSWSQKSLGIALVIDNQGFVHERNIYDNDTAFNFTPFSYALRAL